MNTLLSALPENEHARLSAHLETVALESGQILYEPDEPISHVYFPEGAVLSLLAMADSADAVEVGTIGNAALHRPALRALAAHDARSRGRERIPLTQEFLSFMLGVRRASVSVAAKRLQRRKLIRYSRGAVSVLNRDGLEKAACACYRITRLRMTS